MGSRYERLSDADLLAEQRGAEDAFEAFYRRHVSSVMAYARSRVLDPHTAADIVSATFFAALRSRRSYSAQYDTALPWLVTIASRQILDAERGSRRYERLTSRLATLGLRDLTEADLDGFANAAVGDGRLANALRSLPSDQQLAVTSKVVVGMGYADLAGELGVTQSTARQRVSRALRSLRTQLTTDKDDRDA